MSLLVAVLSKVDKLDLDSQMKIICDELQAEIDKDGVNPDRPIGPNIFLSMNVPGITNKDLCFLCLEREEKGKYIVSLWSKQKDRITQCKRTKVIPITSNKAEEILNIFASNVSYMKGE